MAQKFQQEFKIQFPVLFDASGEIADVLGPTHVPEAFVLNADAEVVYRGRIDDLYGEVGKNDSSHDARAGRCDCRGDAGEPVDRCTPRLSAARSRKSAGDAELVADVQS